MGEPMARQADTRECECVCGYFNEASMDGVFAINAQEFGWVVYRATCEECGRATEMRICAKSDAEGAPRARKAKVKK